VIRFEKFAEQVLTPKQSNRKQQPQLPDYLKYDYEIPAADDDDELDMGSDDEIRIPSLSAASS
jgi:hypothetical protein